MNFMEIVRKRYSVRKYLNKPVEREKIERCIKAAQLAPSTCNSQPWEFLILDKEELKNRVAIETFGPFTSFNQFTLQAPVLIAVITEKSNIIPRVAGIIRKVNFHLIDIGIAVEHVCLQAVEEGLGTCIIGWFNERKVKKVLDIPFGKRIILMITLGYPLNEKMKPRVRKDIDEIRFYNKYKD